MPAAPRGHRCCPTVNQFSYGQVDVAIRLGQFKRDSTNICRTTDNLVTTDRPKDDIYDSIKDFLGKGR